MPKTAQVGEISRLRLMNRSILTEKHLGHLSSIYCKPEALPLAINGGKDKINLLDTPG